MQIVFIDFHPGPPRTIWQGPRPPLHKWTLLKSAPEPGCQLAVAAASVEMV